MVAVMPPPTVKVYYGKPMLPDVSRVLACLYEKEIDFKLVDMYEGHQMPADILKLQATMRAPVPAFEDTGTLLLESRAICRYVSEKYADHGNRYLLGRDLLERGSIEQWLKTEEQSFNPPSWALVFHLAFSPLTYVNGLDQASVTESEKMLARVLDVYEHRLRESEYLAGDEFSLADLSHLPNTHFLANSKEWGYLFDSRKNVQRWWKTISNRPSWAKVVEVMNQDEILKKTSAAKDVATAPSGSTASPEPSSKPAKDVATAPSGSTASPEPSSKPALEQKSSSSSTSKPDSTVDQRNSPEAPTSKPNSQPEPTTTTQAAPQPKQGDSSTGQPASATTQSNSKADAPAGQVTPPTNSETKTISQADSAATTTASDKPKSQPSSDTKPAS